MNPGQLDQVALATIEKHVRRLPSVLTTERHDDERRVSIFYRDAAGESHTGFFGVPHEGAVWVGGFVAGHLARAA